MKKSNSLAKWTIFFGALVVAMIAFVYFGAYNVAASVEHYASTEWVLTAVKERSVAARADAVTVPPELEKKASQGARAYDAMCASCHGAPGTDRSVIGKGLNPLPPELGHAAEEMSAKELFWITKNGIKMTGMPAFGETHADDQLWPIVAFLEELSALDADSYAARVGEGNGHQGEHGGGKADTGSNSQDNGESSHEHDHGVEH